MTISTETPTVIRPPDSKSSGLSRFVRFLGRLLLAFLKLLPKLLIIAGLLAAMWLGYQELHRSIGESTKRVDWNSETSDAHHDWVRREHLIGRTIMTSGGTLIGSVGDVYLGSSTEVKAFALSKVQIESPVASAGLVMRDAVLEVGDDDTFMEVDLTKAEQQSRNSA